ncbi:RNA polymerase sigma-70 factor [Reichenbachiella ulvae]|uniref:RNA polymerase sigma factor SigS n=1 Tax=Reichenbachiella ulvae TaxID=2980104 RepID=A0ABT3CNH5_9BACT|nr:RNA polymerase sigma-70 factor [Reichenbachiella ulvae]MCV9385073.1 RNA polymerase sigma-70 factor [Reichenbachiella ulvae]
MNADIPSQLAQGDKKAFQAIFDQHFHALCGFGYKYLRDTQVIEDLVQDVFVSLWEARTNFEHHMAIKSFLYVSLRNKCLNELKHQVVREKNQEALIYELESEQFFSARVIEEEVFGKLHLEIETLPDSCKQVMLLVLNGLKNREIAEKLSVSENTVKTQKKLGYSKLRQGMGSSFEVLMLAF